MHPWTEDSENPSHDPLPFVLDDHPDRVPDRSAARALEVVHIFGDSVVEVRHLARTAALTLGNPGDLMMPPELVDPTLPVATHDGEAWSVQVDPRWTARRVQSSGEAVVTGAVRLAPGDQLVLTIGPMTVVVREVWRSRRLPVPIGAEVDIPFLALSGLIAAVASITGWFGSLMPPPVHSTNELRDTMEVMILRIPPPNPIDLGAHKPDKTQTTGGGATKAGSRRPSLAREPRPLAGTPKPQGILGVFSDQGVKSVFGEAGLPSALQEGIDTLHGAASAGLEGPGLNGRCKGSDCLGSGLASADGVGDVGTRGRQSGFGDPTGSIERSKHSAKLVVDDPITIGNVDPSEIDRIVKRHLSEIRYCYQRQLQKSPALQGKVKVKFTIAKDGSVSSASPALSTLGDPAVEACISRTFFRMSFPEPKGGGVAIVSYPFLFSPG